MTSDFKTAKPFYITNQAVVPEDPDKDAFFCANDDVRNRYGAPNVLVDNTRGYSDYEQYLFHTMNFNKVYSQRSNNMLFPIRHKKQLMTSWGMLSKLNIKSGQEGVYIAEYFRVVRDVTHTEEFISDMVDYYRYNTSIYPGNAEITTILNNEVVNWGTFKNGMNVNKEFVIRIITFIPKEVLITNGSLYIPSIGVVVGIGDVPVNKLHPESEIYKKYNNKVYSDVKHYIEIDVTTPNDSRPRYVTIGNSVVAIDPVTDSNKDANAIVTVYRDLEMVFTKESSIDNMANELGIYESLDLAKSNGDMSLLNKQKQLTNDLKKIELDYSRLEHLKDKLDYENEKLKESNKLEKERHALEMKKLEHSYETMKIENEALHAKLEQEKEKISHEKVKLIQEKEMRDIEIDTMKFKQDAELKKLDIERNIQELKYNQIRFESKANYVNKLLDLQARREKHTQELTLMDAKHDYDIRINDQKERQGRMGVISNALSLGSTAVKILAM